LQQQNCALAPGNYPAGNEESKVSSLP
jgi:hypothetical protein